MKNISNHETNLHRVKCNGVYRVDNVSSSFRFPVTLECISEKSINASTIKKLL